MEQTRYEKEKQTKEAMRKLLEKNPDGMDGEDFVSTIRRKTGVSRGKIFDLIKLFALTGRMTIERNPKDRRRAIYKPVLYRVKTDRKIYQTTKFIECMKEPTFHEGTRQVGSYNIGVAVFGEGEYASLEQKQRDQEQVAKMVEGALEILPEAMVGAMNLEVAKLVLVFTFEKLERKR